MLSSNNCLWLTIYGLKSTKSCFHHSVKMEHGLKAVLILLHLSKTPKKGREMVTDVQYLHFTMAFEHGTTMQINTLHLRLNMK